MDKPKQVELVKAQAYELDPAKRYILVFDNRAISKEDVSILSGEIEGLGVKGVSVVVKNAQEMVKLIEVPVGAHA